MRLPKSFSKVTVGQYQELAPIYDKIKDEQDAEKVLNGWVNIIAILTDKQNEEIEEWPIDTLKKAIKSLNWLSQPSKGRVKKFIRINGTLYRATLDAKKFNTAQYVEIKTFLGRGGVTPELHNLLATIYSPLTRKGFRHDGKGHAKHAANFRKASIAKVYPTVFFYSRAYESLIRRTLASGIKKAKKEMKKAEKLLTEILKENLESTGVGMS